MRSDSFLSIQQRLRHELASLRKLGFGRRAASILLPAVVRTGPAAPVDQPALRVGKETKS